ncbi:MAG: hypothetical protein NZ899_11585 [Thermoguttaceae bacterium]|nr:hypothetical protein [Thermoguttaceae bacterium]MDW8079519.1 hypothetical protein [Thermoguttaceae bacterium]
MSGPPSSVQCPAGKDLPVAQCCRDLAKQIQDLIRAYDGGQAHAAKNLAASLEKRFPGRACLRYLLWAASYEAGLQEEATRYRELLSEMEPRWPAVFWARMVKAADAGNFFDLVRAYVHLRETFSALPQDQMPSWIIWAVTEAVAREPEVGRILAFLKMAPGLARATEQYLRGAVRSAPNALAANAQVPLAPQRPKAVDGRVRKLPSLIASGSLLTALEVCQAWREKNPKDFSAWWNVVMLQLWLGRVGEAENTLRQMQEAGFSEEDLAEVWSAYFAFVRPWVETALKKPVWSARLSAANWAAFRQSPFVVIRGFLGSRLLAQEPVRVVAFAWWEGAAGGDISSAAEAPCRHIVDGFGFIASDGSAEIRWLQDPAGERLREWVRQAFGVEAFPAATDDVRSLWRERFQSPLPVRTDPRPTIDSRQRASQFFDDLHAYLTGEFLRTPREELAGKTPQEAAGDLLLRPRLLGFLLCLMSEYFGIESTVTSLRRQVGMEPRDLINIRKRPVRSLPAIAFRRIDPQTVKEKDVRYLLKASGSLRGGLLALQALCRIFCFNPAIRGCFSPPDVYFSFRAALLNRLSYQEAQDLLRHVEEEASRQNWQLPISDLLWLWYFAKWGSREEFAKLFWEIRRKYWAQAEVRRFVTDILSRAGILGRNRELPEWLRAAAPVTPEAPTDKTQPVEEEVLAAQSGAEGSSTQPEDARLILPEVPSETPPEESQLKSPLWLPEQGT